MSTQGLRCMITGANGYVGSIIANYLREQGNTVCELRHLTTHPFPHNECIIPYVLEAEVDERIFDHIDALVHCAYDFRWTQWADIARVNVEGSLRLLRCARKRGVRRIIYISTMSAFEGCKSLYGKAKLQVEQEALRSGVVVIRPGLVYGPSPGGMVGALNKAVSRFRVLPLVGGGDYRLYLAHEEDLCGLVYRSIQHTEGLSGPIIAASEKEWTFRSILEVLAEAKGKSLVFIPIPWRLIWVALKGSERIGLPVGFRSDSLVSLVNQDLHPVFDMTRRMGAEFRGFNAQALIS